MNRQWKRTAGLVVGAAVLVVAAGTGGAVAGHQVTSHQIKNHTIRGKDVHGKTLTYGNVKPKARRKLARALGWVTVAADGTVVNHGGILPKPQVVHTTMGNYCVRGRGWVPGAYAATPTLSGIKPLVKIDATGTSGLCSGVFVSTTSVAGDGDNEGFFLVRLG